MCVCLSYRIQLVKTQKQYESVPPPALFQVILASALSSIYLGLAKRFQFGLLCTQKCRLAEPGQICLSNYGVRELTVALGKTCNLYSSTVSVTA